MKENIASELAADRGKSCGLIFGGGNCFSIRVALMRPASLGDNNAVGVASSLDTVDLALNKGASVFSGRVPIEERATGPL